VLVASLPTEMTALIALTHDFGEGAPQVDAVPVDARIEVAGNKGVNASLTREGLTIKQGDEVIYERPLAAQTGIYCEGKASASLRTTKLPDGAVLLRYESLVTWIGNGETCEPDYRPAYTHKELFWIEIGAHGEAARVVSGDWMSDSEDAYNSIDGHSRVFETPAGTFEYMGNSEGSGGFTEDSWSWTLTPPGGEPIALIDIVP